MAVKNALDYVQRALSIIDADNVSAISDSVEGDQVFKLLQNVYDELLSQFPWPHLQEFMNLQVTVTNHIMKLPTDAIGFNYIRYNKDDVLFIEPIEMQRKLDSRDTTLDSVDSNGAINDRDPEFWTTVDDENIIFDSYNVSLQSGLSKIEAIRKPSDLATDTDVPDINERMQPMLRNALFGEALRILKADESRASLYSDKADSQLKELKRWARRFNRVDSWHGRDYGRRNTSKRRGTTVKVIEA